MTKPISPLRQRMIEDMTIRNMSPSTQKVYTYAVANFSAFHGRSPDKLTFEDVRVYRLHLISRGLKPNSINPIMGALRFFYATTCESAWNKDPVFGVIGIQSGPRGRGFTVASMILGSRGWDADFGNDCEDPSRVFCTR